MATEALVIVDWQNEYFPQGHLALEGAETASRNAGRLLDRFRRADKPVIHVRHESPDPGAPFFRPGSYGAAIHRHVQPGDDEPVVLKHHPNAFRETDLKHRLDALGIRQLVIAGAMSHVCIDATARAAVDFGYQVTVVHDAVATRDLSFNGIDVPARHVHSAFMAALAFAYAQAVSIDSYQIEP